MCVSSHMLLQLLLSKLLPSILYIGFILILCSTDLTLYQTIPDLTSLRKKPYRNIVEKGGNAALSPF